MTPSVAETRLLEGRPDLEAFFTRAAEAESVSLARTKPLTGGAIQENWLIVLDITGGPYKGQRKWVLRTDAPSGIATSLTRAQEFRVLQAAHAAGVTVPEPLWLCEDRAVFDRPFYVMRRAGGTANGRSIVKDDGPGGAKPALAERLGRELARIHAITPDSPHAAGLGFLRQPEPTPALALIAELRSNLDYCGIADPALEWGLRWAERQAPPASATTLVHQDFRTGNYMVDSEGLTGILDWEFCGWGDPMSDIGWFCAKCWRFGRPEREAGGIAAREDFYRGYEAESGRKVDEAAVAYWEVVAHLRWAAIALMQGGRFWQAGEGSLELALTGRLAPELGLEVLRLTPPERWS